MRLRVFTTLCLCLAVSAFNITRPHAGEVISIDELYNLTWTTDGVPTNFIVSSIEIHGPELVSVNASMDNLIYFQFGPSDTFITLGTAGHYTLNLSRSWWSVYKDVPHLSWSISLQLFNPIEKHPMLNDTVKVKLTSSKVVQHQRPQLPPMKNFTAVTRGKRKKEASATLGVWPIVLGVLIPILFLAVTIWLGYRWNRGAYSSLSDIGNVKPSNPSSLNCLSAAATRDNEERSRKSELITPHRFPQTFVLAAFLAIAPLLTLFIILVSLLGIYKVEPSTESQTGFSYNDGALDPTAFYVDYDATRYNTVASWTSSIALLLPGSLTSLIWYRETQQLESDAWLAQYDKLLTPYQLSLLLNLKSGTLGSLWDYVLYILSHRREKQARFLSDTGLVVMLSTFLDTWLHIGTATVSLTKATKSKPVWESYGRALRRNCTSGYLASIQQNSSCVLASIDPPALADLTLYTSVLSGKDYDTAIKPFTLGQDRMAYIGPAFPKKHINYRANTFAVRSKCKPIGQWCLLPHKNGSITNATFAICGRFVGVPADPSGPIAQATVFTRGVVNVVTSFFRDRSWLELMTTNNISNSFYTVSRLESQIRTSGHRPAHFSTPASSHGLPSYSTSSNHDSVSSRINFISYNTELVNLTYEYVNGSIKSANITLLNDLDMFKTIFQPALQNFDPFITSRAAITAMSDNINLAIENWIDILHKYYFAFAAMATEEAGNIDQQEWRARLVACIPRAPLLTLGVFILLSILFNAFILVMSLRRTSLGKTHQKQVIISVAGLAANTFESKVADTGHAVSNVWDLFDESKEETPSTRIGVGEDSAGGHHFIAFVAGGVSVKDVGLDRDSEPGEEVSGRKLLKTSVTF